jgi:nucleotide-binding universal stress UspA family protein
MLHAVELPAMGYPDGPVYSGIDFQGMLEDGKQRVELFLKSEFQDVPTTRLMLEGDPARRIAEFAEKEKVDLIMMPTHGYGRFRRLLLGSVTAKVLHDVNCPVWTNAHTPDRPALPGGYRNILCALDYTPENLPLLRWASLFACEQGATLKLVHAIPAAKVPGALEPEGGRFRTSLFEMAREELAKLQKEAVTDEFPRRHVTQNVGQKTQSCRGGWFKCRPSTVLWRRRRGPFHRSARIFLHSPLIGFMN